MNHFCIHLSLQIKSGTFEGNKFEVSAYTAAKYYKNACGLWNQKFTGVISIQKILM